MVRPDGLSFAGIRQVVEAVLPLRVYSYPQVGPDFHVGPWFGRVGLGSALRSVGFGRAKVRIPPPAAAGLGACQRRLRPNEFHFLSIWLILRAMPPALPDATCWRGSPASLWPAWAWPAA